MSDTPTSTSPEAAPAPEAANMPALVEFLIRPLLQHPEDFHIDAIEGEASLLLEIEVHDGDRERLQADGGRLFQSIQQVVSASGGQRKTVLELYGLEDPSDDPSTFDGEALNADE